jgi:5'-AMP-activated protein kinase catalytic alpha subunit
LPLSKKIISGERYNPITVDIWSSGITLFAMICGFLPFDEESKSVLYKKILSTDYSIPKHVSAEARDLIKRILVKDINQRLTIS